MPVEITDFCWKYNLQRLQNLPEVKGCEAKLRTNADGTPYVTDNKNYIVDLYFKTPIKVLPAGHPQRQFDVVSASRTPLALLPKGFQGTSQSRCCGHRLTLRLVHARTPKRQRQQSQRSRVSWTMACSWTWSMCASLLAAAAWKCERSELREQQ